MHNPFTQITESAFFALFEATRHNLYRLFLLHTKDAHTTEDLLQDCYLRAWEKREIINSVNGEKYITGIAFNLLTDWHRATIKKKLVYMEELPEVSGSITPAESFGFKETQHIIQKTLGTLSSDKKNAFRLIKDEEKSYFEAAKELSTPVSTLEKRIAVSLKELKRVLSAVCFLI